MCPEEQQHSPCWQGSCASCLRELQLDRAAELSNAGSTKCSGLGRSDSSSHLRSNGCVCVHESKDLGGNGQSQALCVWRGDWEFVMWEIVGLEVACGGCSGCTAASDSK